MTRIISTALGGLCLAWYAFAYPYLFEYFMLDISLMSTLGNCREQYGIETCRLFARAIFHLQAEGQVLSFALPGKKPI